MAAGGHLAVRWLTVSRVDRPSVLLTVLGVAYTVLAVAALARSGYQAFTGAGSTGRTWVAVALSGAAGLVYLLAAIGLRRGTVRALRISRWCCAVELFGVIAVSLVEVWIGGFGRAAVWSGFGVGYGYAPLLLPLLGLWATRPAARRSHVNAPGRGRRGYPTGVGTRGIFLIPNDINAATAHSAAAPSQAIV